MLIIFFSLSLQKHSETIFRRHLQSCHLCLSGLSSLLNSLMELNLRYLRNTKAYNNQKWRRIQGLRSWNLNYFLQFTVTATIYSFLQTKQHSWSLNCCTKPMQQILSILSWNQLINVIKTRPSLEEINIHSFIGHAFWSMQVSISREKPRYISLDASSVKTLNSDR